jgi:hypothetical protein
MIDLRIDNHSRSNLSTAGEPISVSYARCLALRVVGSFDCRGALIFDQEHGQLLALCFLLSGKEQLDRVLDPVPHDPESL